MQTKHSSQTLLYLLLGSLLLAANLVQPALPAAAQDGSMLRGLQPDWVFEIAVQFDDDGMVYHYADMGGDEGACDMTQPVESRECHYDLTSLARHFEQLVAVEYVPGLPASVQWHVGGPMTPVYLAAEVRQWDAQTNQARQWRIACSVLPDQPDMAVCAVIDRLDHFNYVLVYAAGLEQVRVAFGG